MTVHNYLSKRLEHERYDIVERRETNLLNDNVPGKNLLLIAVRH
jgi:hypothetical protein